MVFSNLVFLYIFLPAVLFSYFIAPRFLKNTVLLLASLFFYAWGEPTYIFLMIFSIIMNYLFGIFISNSRNISIRKLIVILSVITNIGILGFYKYANFLVGNVNSLLNTNYNLQEIPLPIGISFFTFQAMSYVIDVYRKTVPAQKNFLDLSLYISLFPQLVAGPIVRYKTVAEQIKSRIISLEKFSEGVERFILGLSKKVLIANPLGAIADEIFSLPASELTTTTTWIGIIAYTLQIYFDFSGYSDMAIGLGKLFGFDFEENFRYPYISKSISEFWRRWHISLGKWFRDYVYIPLGGNRVKIWKVYFNLLIVWTLTGFWHGASWTFMIWGFYYGFIICLEKFGLEKLLQRAWQPVQHLYVLLIVMIGWVFFRADNFAFSNNYIKTMFGFAGDFHNTQALLYIMDNWMVFLLGIIFSMPIYPIIRNKINEFSNKMKGLLFIKEFSESLFYLILLLVCTMYIVNSTYNPFIYFRF
ncbi:alginate O-acetyltransferase complex protein AlgI [Bacillus pakistanensis]|uniref:Alginate O-acetyltransferase complex protein AlgI n=1 Tax=Rossellomorea pakistanensis TaxID=992288 RepID=A0ABS2ND67_9BACI|nr:MBOAT family protein [Bacillus pakistanensis]MBM7585759.1 alginate O-acetyltransferase complex protein AlgI [Bacillus pakistanensis]